MAKEFDGVLGGDRNSEELPGSMGEAMAEMEVGEEDLIYGEFVHMISLPLREISLSHLGC